MSEQQMLDQAQIWDDSALQTIWNTSVKEYQRYHSIHARGEDVGEVLRQAADAESGGDDVDVDVKAQADLDADDLIRQVDSEEDGEIPDDRDNMDEDGSNSYSSTQSKPEAKPSLAPVNGTTKIGPVQPNGLSSIPQPMITQSTHDEALKNLMMSWYWAGYYTGLHEGQQQGRADSATNGT